jgi:hypothetical protein
MPLHFGVRSCLLSRSILPFTTHRSMGDAASADATAGTLRHKALSVYYPVLTTLGAHLAATPTLRYGSSDPGDYLDLLSTTICAPNAQAGTAPPPEPVQCTQQEAIDRIVQELVTTKGPRGDALVWGTKVPSLRHPSPQLCERTSPADPRHGTRAHILTSPGPASRRPAPRRPRRCYAVGHGTYFASGKLPWAPCS